MKNEAIEDRGKRWVSEQGDGGFRQKEEPTSPPVWQDW